jgi:ribosomal protein S18 acetylase RimI-like enzyme
VSVHCWSQLPGQSDDRECVAPPEGDDGITSTILVAPTQLYISRAKLERARRYLEACDYADYDPLPVKQIGRVLFFTDGHSRALLLWRAGHTEIVTVPDEDEMEWASYLENVEWCRQAGIATIAGLDGRVVSEAKYQVLWRDRCETAHDNMPARTLAHATVKLETDTEQRSALCAAILAALPEWFGIESANAAYVSAVRELDVLVLRVFGVAVGLCALKNHTTLASELYLLGIAPELHRRGLGTRLVSAALERCRQAGRRYLTVKTLSERHPDPHYARTRRFYEKMGFVALEELPELWGVENPCLYMVRDVATDPTGLHRVDSRPD